MKPPRDQVTNAKIHLTAGHQALQLHTGKISLEYLEGVAKIRFSLSVVATLLNRHVSERTSDDSAFIKELLPTVKDVSTNKVINCLELSGARDATGPAIYLLKLVVLHYGSHCLDAVTCTPSLSCDWLVPPELKMQEVS